MPTLKELRLSAGLTQAQAGFRVGVIQQNISRWEKGKRRPNIDYALLLAQAYGVTVEEIIQAL